MRSVEPDSSPSSSSMGWNFRGLFSNRIWKHSLKKHIITNHNASVAYHDKHVTLAWVCVLTGVQVEFRSAHPLIVGTRLEKQQCPGHIPSMVEARSSQRGESIQVMTLKA